MMFHLLALKDMFEHELSTVSSCENVLYKLMLRNQEQILWKCYIQFMRKRKYSNKKKKEINDVIIQH